MKNALDLYFITRIWHSTIELLTVDLYVQTVVMNDWSLYA